MQSKQYHFYLNPEKITDYYIMGEIAKEKNISSLIKGLLYDYFKNIKPKGDSLLINAVSSEKESED